MTTPQTRHMSFSQNLLLNHRLYKNVKKIHTQHDQNHQLIQAYLSNILLNSVNMGLLDEQIIFHG
ncbi:MULTISPECIES: hypothetical protein [Candidatus Williamhamiltonella]|uniref:Uncharacterized protein n=1 Tax=Candidatus Williamhamiltonella defendens TaxID=138072 RepID=A0A2D3TBU2_9ENTR|nr:hypothetical protein [Candidatus Hamiltonella defensa]ATW33258.1 hypothetical protein BJP43_01995 [Candidatus Hamiltonella defensa]AYB49269.1 hypothetical protein CJJ19_07005 [Candidatus Hamiltonella defensa]